MIKIAVTGGIACGKSLVGKMLKARNIPVCDADDLAHAELQRGCATYREVVDYFGNKILDSRGEISRPMLAAIVFKNPVALVRLNGMVHPPVRKAWRRWLAKEEGRGVRASAVLIPLLYEAGFDSGWDVVISVGSSAENQVARLRKRGMSAAAAMARIKAQWPQEKKSDLSDYVIVNNGTVDVLEEQVSRIVKSILERKSYGAKGRNVKKTKTHEG